MLAFKKDVDKILPYNRREYIEFLLGDITPSVQWYGVSFQLPGGYEGRTIGFKEYLQSYEIWFRNLIAKVDNSACWVVNHDFIDQDWFPDNGSSLKSLRMLFKQNKVPYNFKGALVFTKETLLAFSKDIITYPFAMFKGDSLYNDLDISHSELPFVIKISGHRNIDLLSMNKELLRNIVDKGSPGRFIIREYNGTSFS